MTLLERWDSQKRISGVEVDNQEIRRAIAIAQAVEEWQRDGDVTAQFIMRRADELLAKGKPEVLDKKVLV